MRRVQAAAAVFGCVIGGLGPACTEDPKPPEDLTGDDDGGGPVSTVGPETGFDPDETGAAGSTGGSTGGPTGETGQEPDSSGGSGKPDLETFEWCYDGVEACPPAFVQVFDTVDTCVVVVSENRIIESEIVKSVTVKTRVRPRYCRTDPWCPDDPDCTFGPLAHYTTLAIDGEPGATVAFPAALIGTVGFAEAYWNELGVCPIDTLPTPSEVQAQVHNGTSFEPFAESDQWVGHSVEAGNDGTITLTTTIEGELLESLGVATADAPVHIGTGVLIPGNPDLCAEQGPVITYFDGELYAE